MRPRRDGDRVRHDEDDSELGAGGRDWLRSAEPERVGRDGVAVFAVSGTGVDEDEGLAKDARELVKVFRVDRPGARGRVRTVRHLVLVTHTRVCVSSSALPGFWFRLWLGLGVGVEGFRMRRQAQLAWPDTVTTSEGGEAPLADPVRRGGSRSRQLGPGSEGGGDELPRT